MIDSNLSVLLAERNLRISKVSKDTGISRTTLTSLCYDYSGGIKYDTLNTLCMYLGVSPSEFFNFVPYDYSVDKASAASGSESKNRKYSSIGEYEAVITVTNNQNHVFTCPVLLSITNSIKEDETKPYDHDNNRYKALFLAIYEKYLDSDPEITNEYIIAKDEVKNMYKMCTYRQKTDFNSAILDLLTDDIFKDLDIFRSESEKENNPWPEMYLLDGFYKTQV